MLVRLLVLIAVSLSAAKLAFDGRLDNGARVGVQAIAELMEQL